MRKALVTFATPNYADFLDIARPSFVAYAKAHGYAYLEAQAAQLDFTRPPSWSKVPVLLDALATYDAALWVDCDAVIVDGSQDIAAVVRPDAWQAMALHHTHKGLDLGEVPSCGTWFVRKAMIPVLQEAWQMTQYLHHPWWEQAALHQLLGYVHNGAAIFPVRRGPETELRRHTHFLPYAWASVDYDNANAQARVMHVPGVMTHNERLRTLASWAERAVRHE